MRDGFLPVDKPSGPTSHDVVACVRKRFNTRRVGHTGTLDPFATGLLLVFVGRATRLVQFLASLPKAYTGTISLGMATTTDDHTGEPLSNSEAWRSITDQDIATAMEGLTGQYEQQPPVYSAKKVGGHPAHRLARRGIAVALAPALVDVQRFALTRRSGSDLAFDARVGSGVYVRAMARDLGERLGCGAHLRELRRVAIGPFQVGQAVTLEAVVSGDVALRPAAEAVAHLDAVQLDDSAREFVRHGRAIPGGGSAVAPVALLAGAELVGVAQPLDGFLHPKVVLDA
ncbi:MAG: tRNA pseudouridine(55) synthase TruB [Gemmatimonadetes bacterium]|nr:tRNA pseudouridine(55) synthase TruB [Gemmatimonadota bacterium]